MFSQRLLKRRYKAKTSSANIIPEYLDSVMFTNGSNPTGNTIFSLYPNNPMTASATSINPSTDIYIYNNENLVRYHFDNPIEVSDNEKAIGYSIPATYTVGELVQYDDLSAPQSLGYMVFGCKNKADSGSHGSSSTIELNWIKDKPYDFDLQCVLESSYHSGHSVVSGNTYRVVSGVKSTVLEYYPYGTNYTNNLSIAFTYTINSSTRTIYTQTGATSGTLTITYRGTDIGTLDWYVDNYVDDYQYVYLHVTPHITEDPNSIIA